MKRFKQYLAEKTDGLGDLGNQDLADDHDQPDTAPPDMTEVPSENHELQIVRKAMKIALASGEPYRHKVHSFLHRLARDIPQLHNLVSQLNSDDDDENKKDGDKLPENPNGAQGKPVVSTPSADVPSDSSTME